MSFKPFSGPKSFVFKDPDTGFEYKAKTRRELITYIVSYRAQNELPQIEYLPAVLENYWCHLKENCGNCEPNKQLQRGILQTIRGGIALLENFLFSSFATQEVAEQRAKQCEECPFNIFPDKSGFVSWADNLATAMVGERRTSNAALLGSCEACTCVLKGKVFYNGKIKPKAEEYEKMRRVDCWQLQLMEK